MQPAAGTGPQDDGYRLEYRALWMPKAGHTAEEYEDAFAVDPSQRLVVLGDGAGSGIFSRRWVRILTRGVIEAGTRLTDPAVLASWLEGCRERWRAGIDRGALRYTQRLRLDSVGAGATLLVLRLAPPSADDGHLAGAVAWTAWAVGDSCLFRIGDNRLQETFPIASSDEFAVSTPLLQTRADSPVVTPLTTGGLGKLGDFFLLATDATAQLLLRRCECGDEPDWQRFWHVSNEDWREEMAALREREQVVDDDCTLLAVRLRPDAGAENEPTVTLQPGDAL